MEVGLHNHSSKRPHIFREVNDILLCLCYNKTASRLLIKNDNTGKHPQDDVFSTSNNLETAEYEHDIEGKNEMSVVCSTGSDSECIFNNI